VVIVALGVVVRIALVAVGRNLIGVPDGVAHLGRSDVVEADDRLHGVSDGPNAHGKGQDGRQQKGQNAPHTTRVAHLAR